MADDSDDDLDGGDPLGDLADRIRSRRSEPSLDHGGAEDDNADFEGLEEFFESEPYDEVDADELWDSLEEDSGVGDGVETGESSDEHIVPKRAYCEGCEHFSEPPDIHCNHAGTTIVEYVDLDHVRVRNCPIVAQRQALGERDEGPMTQMSFGSQGQD